MREDWQQLIETTVQNKCLQNAYAWEPFARGSSNSIFLGRLNSENGAFVNNKPSAEIDTKQNKLAESTVVLRINAPLKDTPGVKRDREAAILNWINPYGWAPQVIRNEPEQGWCLMHHYEPLKTEGDKLSSDHQIQLIKALDELQAIPVDSEPANLSNEESNLRLTKNALTMDYEVFLNETYLPLAIQRSDAVAQTWIHSIKDDLATLPKLPSCLVHHDIHSGNLVLSNSPLQTKELNADLIILDWEYAAIGNPWFDASCLSRYLSIPAQGIYSLSMFKTLDETVFKSALKQANHMTEVLQDLWHWARER